MTPDVQAVLRAELIVDEDKRLVVYDDATGKPIVPGTLVKGNPSIGVGRNLSGRGISDSEAENMLANDLAQAYSDLLPLLPWLAGLSAHRQVVIYSLYFNTGEGNPHGFIAKWPNFLRQMMAGQFDVASQNLRTSQPWASEVGQGRVNRLVSFILNG